MPNYRLLNNINYPSDLKKLNVEELKELAVELRTELIDVVSETGGHLGAGLGVIELTIALHYIFDTPRDKLVWDVGHQSYPHKILTGRKNEIRTIRQGNGLSGFTKRSESEYDTFGAAHSSTSISSGLGISVAKSLSNSSNHVIAVIGDGAMSAGMAGGQYLDLNFEHKKVNKLLLTEMQTKKTGKLFSFCCGSSAIIEEKKLSVKRDLNQIGLQIGFLYQISDDLIDVRGNSNQVGKSTKKDTKRGKATLINLLGYNNALKFAYSLKSKIVNKIKKYGKKSCDLLESLEYIIHREV